jgi:hypothetical protein
LGARAAAQPTGPGLTAAEQSFEQIAEVDALGSGHALELARVEALRAGSSAARAVAAAEPRPERARRVALGVNLAAVETGALVLVAQQVIGLGDVGETLRRLRIVLVAIGVQFLGKLAVGGLDVLLTRIAGNAQGGIGIGHGVLARQNTGAAQAALSYMRAAE